MSKSRWHNRKADRACAQFCVPKGKGQPKPLASMVTAHKGSLLPRHWDI